MDGSDDRYTGGGGVIEGASPEDGGVRPGPGNDGVHEDDWDDLWDSPPAEVRRPRRAAEGPYQGLPLHRMLAYGRDHGPDAPGLAAAVGAAVADDLTVDGLTEEQRLDTLRAVGERVLSTVPALTAAEWLDRERQRDAGAVEGPAWTAERHVGAAVAEGLPLAGEAQWFGYDTDGRTPGTLVTRSTAAVAINRRLANAVERLEGPATSLWELPRDTPSYLLPRAEMGGGDGIADPVLRELVDRAWDARVQLHLTEQANSHPANREDLIDRMKDSATDADRLDAVLVKVGERVLAGGPPEAADPDGHELRLRRAGEALLRATYAEGCARADRADDLWANGEWDALAGSWLTPAEADELRLWVARDYAGLQARGIIDASDREVFTILDAPVRRAE